MLQNLWFQISFVRVSRLADGSGTGAQSRRRGENKTYWSLHLVERSVKKFKIVTF